MANGSTGRRYDAEFMRGQLAQARARDWSLVRLARESGISLPTLCRWRRRLDGDGAARFVELVARPGAPPSSGDVGRAAAGSTAPLEVVLRGGARLLVGESASELLLERVIGVLARTC